MSFIVENWSAIASVLAIIVVASIYVIRFFRAKKDLQIKNVKEWLLYETSRAEKELGSGTGKLKLRKVYDRFVVNFPWLAKILPFEQFSILVDEALVEMNRLLATNESVQLYVNGSKEEKIEEV